VLFFSKHESVLCEMQLTVRDASGLINIPEKMIYRLIKRNGIPFYRLKKSYFFNRAELLEWAISHSVGVSPDLFKDRLPQASLPDLAGALERGGVHTISGASTKRDVLRNVVALMPDLTDAGRDAILQALLARESLGSTAIGGGIAIPHVRNPIVLDIKEPLILLCFLEPPIDFGAKDEMPVSTIFTMISPNARIHLHLLARLSFALKNNAVRGALIPSNNLQTILYAVRAAEPAVTDATGSFSGKTC
jgi:nitrogen PTS system EIIA component